MPRRRYSNAEQVKAVGEIGTIGFYGALVVVPTVALFLILDPLRNTDIFLVYILFLAISFPLFLFTRVEMRVNLQKAIVSVWYGLFFGAILILSQQFVSVTMSVWQRNLSIGMAPFTEEFFFRGLILGAFLVNRNAVAIALGLFMSSLGFAVFHFYVYSIADPAMFTILFVGGLVLGLCYVITRRLDCCIIAHLFNNGLALVWGA